MAIGAIRNIGGGGGKKNRRYEFSVPNDHASHTLYVDYYENDKLVSHQDVQKLGWDTIAWSSPYLYALPSVKIDTSRASWYIFTNGSVKVNGANYNKDVRLIGSTVLNMGYGGHYTAQVEFQ